jgi:hypothetical protein
LLADFKGMYKKPFLDLKAGIVEGASPSRYGKIAQMNNVGEC